jgi:hypothetical protein
METVKNWAFSICCASIAGGILNMLLPKGGAQATYKTVFCVFFLCVMIAPLSDMNFRVFDILEPKIIEEDSENIFSNSSMEYLENEIVASVKEILKDENIICEDISVKVNISENGSINITKFTLTLDNSESADNLAEKIGRILGINPEIVISGENSNG